MIAGQAGTTDTAQSTSSLLWWALVVLAIALVAVVLWVRRKGRLMPGDHVFRASRLTRGNHLFPAQVAVAPASVTFYRPQWFGRLEESIHMAHISSVRVDTHVFFADVFIETSGGQDPIRCHGHRKSDVQQIKSLIEKFQSEYYRGSGTGR